MSAMLTGIKVLEMANVISGPFGSMLLADLGAEVIKVEMPGTGDPFRNWAGEDAGEHPAFAAFNRGKKSITVNVKTEEGRALYLRFDSDVDVVLDNFRPGILDKLGVGYDEICKTNSEVVYCAATGMGTVGPYRDRPTYDAIAQAMSGLWSQLSDVEDPEPVGPPLSDQLTGIYTAYGILGALVSKLKTGKGRKINVSMLGASLAFQPLAVADYLLSGKVADKSSRPHLSQSYTFVGQDGLSFAVHLSSPPKFWKALLVTVGRPELEKDPRFVKKADRVDHYDELRAELQAEFARRPREYWLAELVANDVPAGPIYTIEEALNDPQVKALDMVRTFGTGTRATPLVGYGVDDETRPRDEAHRPVPGLGEHTGEILTNIGYSQEEIESLVRAGAV